MQKIAFRKMLKSRLEAMPESLKNQKSKLISMSLLSLLNSPKFLNLKIGFFAPFWNEEPDIFSVQIFDDIEQSFPFIEDDLKMSFRLCPFGKLEKLHLFNREFLTPNEISVKVCPEVVLVPGLGFDQLGQRLGRGKGYYDRYLADKNVIKIGLCFQEQLVDKIPTDSFDVKMDFIITDKEVLQIQIGE